MAVPFYVPHPAIPARPPAKPLRPVPIVGQTPPHLDMYGQARQMVADQLTAARQPLLEQQHAQDTQTAAHAQAIQGFTQALATLLGQIAPHVSDAYNTAANTQGALGRGLSDAAQGAVAGAYKSGNDFAAMMGAPAGSVAATPDVGSYVYGANAYLPASTMNREGAAFASAAALAPRTAASSGLQDLMANLYAGTDADQKIAQQIADLEAKSPGLVQNALAQLEDAHYKAQDLVLRTQTARSTQLYRNAQLGLATKKDAYNEWLSQKKLGQTSANQSFNQWAKTQGLRFQGQRVSIAQQNANTAVGRAGQAQSNADRNYQIARDRLSLAQQTHVDALQQKMKTGGFTPSQISKFKNTAADTAADAWFGIKEMVPEMKNGKKTGRQVWTKNWLQEPMHYQEILVKMVDHGIPLTVAQNALNRYWKRPGYDADINGRKTGKTYWFTGGTGRPGSGQTYQDRNPGKAPASARTPQGAKETAFQIAQSKYGWGGNELAALEQLWSGESGWDFTATNPTSGAAGIPQALGHKLPTDYATNPVSQINWGLNYIRQRYGTPSKALAFWSNNSPHWY